MKKILALATTLAFCLVALTGCFGPTPTETATMFLEGIKAQDAEMLAEVYSDPNFEKLGTSSNEEPAQDADFSTDVTVNTDEFSRKLLEFDYEVTNEVVDGDTATVDVNIITYNAGEAFYKYFEESFLNTIELSFSGLSEAEIQAANDAILADKVAQMEKTYTETVSLPMTKVDGRWVIDEITYESGIANALSGGMFKTLQGVTESL